jgi:hypothetical protein
MAKDRVEVIGGRLRWLSIQQIGANAEVDIGESA